MRMISVIVPLFDERHAIGPLSEAIRSALADTGAWELILVDDGSVDDTAAVARRLAAEDSRIRVVELARNYGQAIAMQAGFDHVRGDIVVSLDGDLQNDPRDIPRLVAQIRNGYDLVAGYRERRQDKLLTRRVPSWIANRIIKWITGVAIRDNGCSLKAYRREVLERMTLYSDMHRFIPAMAVATSGARITEVPVRHHPRRYGTSKYGLSRVPKVLADLLTIAMIRSFRDRPLRLFGAWAFSCGIVALLFAAGAIAAILEPEAVGSLVILPGAALLWIGLGFYLFMLGLISETVVWEQFAEEVAEFPIAREVSA